IPLEIGAADELPGDLEVGKCPFGVVPLHPLHQGQVRGEFVDVRARRRLVRHVVGGHGVPPTARRHMSITAVMRCSAGTAPSGESGPVSASLMSPMRPGPTIRGSCWGSSPAAMPRVTIASISLA